MPNIYGHQDDCLIAITDGRPVPSWQLSELPPWRAVMVARLADKAGVPLQHGTVEELIAEAARVGGQGRLVWPPQIGEPA